jgi:hypothetical protein
MLGKLPFSRRKSIGFSLARDVIRGAEDFVGASGNDKNIVFALEDESERSSPSVSIFMIHVKFAWFGQKVARFVRIIAAESLNQKIVFRRWRQRAIIFAVCREYSTQDAHQHFRPTHWATAWPSHRCATQKQQNEQNYGDPLMIQRPFRHQERFLICSVGMDSCNGSFDFAQAGADRRHS